VPKRRPTISKSIEDMFGTRLKKSRLLREMSATALHERTGIAKSSLTRYEKGDRTPGCKELRLLCEALDVSPSYLLWGDESKEFGKLTISVYDMEFESDDQLSAFVAVLFSMVSRPDRTAILQLLYSNAVANVGEDKLKFFVEALPIIVSSTEDLISEWADNMLESISKRLESSKTEPT
jgi:transcriptional regulator with XRE-family HTH domain